MFSPLFYLSDITKLLISNISRHTTDIPFVHAFQLMKGTQYLMPPPSSGEVILFEAVAVGQYQAPYDVSTVASQYLMMPFYFLIVILSPITLTFIK